MPRDMNVGTFMETLSHCCHLILCLLAGLESTWRDLNVLKFIGFYHSVPREVLGV